MHTWRKKRKNLVLERRGPIMNVLQLKNSYHLALKMSIFRYFRDTHCHYKIFCYFHTN